MIKKLINIVLISTIAIFLSGCFCLTCSGNGTCYGKAKCVGSGFCKNGYGKCIRIKTKVKELDKEIEKIAFTCKGFGSCDGKLKCDGEIIKEGSISYCKGKMECSEGSGTCNGDGWCTAGIGVCDGKYANCVGDGTCQGVGLCLGLPAGTIDGDIMLKSELSNHKKSIDEIKK